MTPQDRGIKCPCKSLKCERYGDCEACMAHHHAPKKKLLTACERLRAKEERKRTAGKQK